MNIRQIHEFDVCSAAKELLSSGVTAVDDISELLYENALEELFDALGLAGDDLDIVADKIHTNLGPVFVFRDRRRLTLKKARMYVAQQRALCDEGTTEPSE